jgi:hypothetical protein
MPVRPESSKNVRILFYLLLCTTYFFQRNFAKENIFAVAVEIKVARYEAQKKYRLRQIALSSPGKIFASPNSVEIFVARYQAQEKYLLRQIALSSPGKIFASPNSVEIFVARYQAQEKYLLRQIAWKFWLRVIKPRKNICFAK